MTDMWKPLDNRVMIEPLPREETMLGKYDMPSSAIKPPSEGKVVSIGESATELKVGNIVRYDVNFGVEFIDGDKVYRIMEKRDIFAQKSKTKK